MAEEKKSERRGGNRLSMVDTAQFTELRAQNTSKARLYDLSPTGCYLEMLNPPPKGTEIRVRLDLRGKAFEAQAVVVRCEPNMGMGVLFTQIDAAFQEILDKFLRPEST